MCISEVQEDCCRFCEDLENECQCDRGIEERDAARESFWLKRRQEAAAAEEAAAKPEMAFTHKWEQFGYTAPFKYLALITLPNPEGHPTAVQEAYCTVAKQNKHYGVFAGSCNLCGNGLKNNFVIGDADGNNFIVGCDCVQHLNDTKLITKVEKAEKLRKKAIRDAKAKAKWEAKAAKLNAELEAQRVKNGGMTDDEVERENWKKEQAAKREAITAENNWLIDRLYGTGNFVTDMKKELESNKVVDFSPRAIEILKDIYAKSFGRRNSKAYWAACDEFNANAGL